MHPSSLRRQIHYPLPVAQSLTHKQMKEALVALTGYLTEVRIYNSHKSTIAGAPSTHVLHPAQGEVAGAWSSRRIDIAGNIE